MGLFPGRVSAFHGSSIYDYDVPYPDDPHTISILARALIRCFFVVMSDKSILPLSLELHYLALSSNQIWVGMLASSLVCFQSVTSVGISLSFRLVRLCLPAELRERPLSSRLEFSLSLLMSSQTWNELEFLVQENHSRPYSQVL